MHKEERAMRGKRVLALLLALAAILAACAPAAAPTPVTIVKKETQVVEIVVTATPEPRPEAPPALKVAILLPGPIADGGWNQQAYESVGRLREQGFDVAYVESLPVADMPVTARGYAEDGYDYVAGHGFQFVSSFMELAPDYPDTNFFVTSTAPQGETIPGNLKFVNPGYHMGGYLAGVLAAMVSESGIVGIVGGADNPVQRSIANAFVQGAEDTVPGTTGLMVISGSYNDAALGREAALTMIGNGADTIMHWANVTGFGAIGAVVESGKTMIGVYSDQSPMSYNNFASSLTMDLGYLIEEGARETRDGTFPGGEEWHPPFEQVYKFKQGSAEFNPNKVTPEMSAEIAQITKDILSGKIEVVLNMD
jgi:basic membrane protein A